MTGNPDSQEMAQLLAIPAFRKLLWRIFEASGIMHAAYGTDGRDLAFREGRRSLGLDILRMADAGQPFAHPSAVSTWLTILGEEETSHMEAQNAHRRRPAGARDERDADE